MLILQLLSTPVVLCQETYELAPYLDFKGKHVIAAVAHRLYFIFPAQ